MWGSVQHLTSGPVRLLRLASFLVLASLWLVVPLLGAGADERVVEVIEMRGALDTRLLDFVIAFIDDAAASGEVEVVILQIDSPGLVSGVDRLQRLTEILAAPPIPIAVWVGPAPAVAYGGAAQLLAAAPLAAVAPGSEIGFAAPTVAGGAVSELLVPVPDPLATESMTVSADTLIPGMVDVVQPSLRQFVILDLDGRTLDAVDGPRLVSTVVPFVADDGTEGVTHLPTVIRQPNLWDQFLRLAVRPETAFFLLVAGLTVAAFEFYAIGPGIAAGVAALSLGLAGYGVAVQPVRGWAIGMAAASIVVLSAAHQRGGSILMSALGIGGLTISGFWFTDAAPQIVPATPGVILTVAAAAFFFLLAMPTVARARFSTQTIGREQLIGRRGLAASTVAPDGEVEVNGARWKATAHRESGIGPGDPVVVTAVDGWFLEVEPADQTENAKT